MKKLFYIVLLIAIGSFLPQDGFSQDFVYKPINPSFGGETFNYNWLLNSAQVQDLLEDPEQVETGRSSLTDFTESLNRQLLSQLSRQLVTTQFGEAGLEEGSYTIGSYNIDVANTLDGLTITVFDAALGDQTQIIIPYY